jgi:hypothetical protein
VASNSDDKGSTSRQQGKMRRFVAGAVAVVGASIVFVGYFVPAFQVCQQQLASTGDAGVVDICAPVGLPGLVPIVLVVAVLLWPDLSEVTVTGLFSLRRRIEEQAERQADLEDRLFQVQQATQQATQQTNVLISSQALTHLPEQTRQKAELVERAGPAEGEGASPPIAEERMIPETEAAELGMSLLYLWEQIADVLALIDDRRGIRRPRRDRVEDTAELDRIIRWRNIFDREIEIVRAARNSVAHPGTGADLSTDELLSVVRTAEYLLALLRNEPPERSPSLLR